VETINELGIQLIVFLQALGGWLEAPMRFFTFLGSEDFFLLVLPIIYWSINSSLGMRVGYILLFNQGLNHLLKLALAGPRPYWVSQQVRALEAEGSFGAPSGHAESAMGVWGIIAAFLKKSWAWAVAFFVILMIGLSRLYLAVHFPHDVLLGWLIGALSLWLFVAWWDRAAAWLKTLTFGQQVGLAFSVSIGFISAAVLLGLARRGYILNDAWAANMLRASTDLPEPLALSGMITVAGMLFGLSLGLAWMERHGGFQASGSPTTRVLCYLIGLVGVMVLWNGLGAVFPRGEELLPYILRYIRYTLVGAWVTAGAPWLFIRLKLVGSPARQAREARAA
jgi:membrane-associated phospholipid phosphatase